ncbi:TPA: hypothetical protein NKU37_002944 [Vibrio parahaemolyticus]|nr:hypothetical protein [Vibrio parahaemolyticus]
MKTFLLMLFITSPLWGCASEQYFVGNGAEALVYKEHHSFEITMKNHGEMNKQMAALIQDIESIDRDASYVVDYKSMRIKAMLQKIFEQYPSHVIRPQRVLYRSAQSLPSDLKIQVTLTRLKAQECEPAQIHVRLRKSECFAETMRLKQVAYKSRLVGEQ